MILDTLARADWELGDKPNAIEIQREAIAVQAAGMGEPPTAEAKALAAGLAATLASYESLPAGAALPKEPVGVGGLQPRPERGPGSPSAE